MFHCYYLYLLDKKKSVKGSRYKISEFVDKFHSDSFKYALKTSVVVSLLILLQFFETTGPTFQQWRGEWALVSVCSLTFAIS